MPRLSALSAKARPLALFQQDGVQPQAVQMRLRESASGRVFTVYYYIPFGVLGQSHRHKIFQPLLAS